MDVRHTSRPALFVLGGFLLLTAIVGAHEVPIEQLVDVTVTPQIDRLLVSLHVPAAVLADAKLPTRPDGTLDAARLEGPLALVAADTARSLDVQQDDAVLAAQSVAARLGTDRKSVDIDLAYRTNGGPHGFSARLSTFPSEPMRPVRTTVRYLAASGPQLVSVTGPTTRVFFDPSVLDVMSQFVAHALGSILAAGDHLLWLVCLLLPIRSARDAARLVGATCAAQALGIVACLAAPEQTGALVSSAGLIAASAIVIGALQNVVQARLQWVAALAFAFGLFNGPTFGAALATAQPLAGSHQAIASAVFLSTIIAGQIWLAAVLWATRAWLAGLGLSERVVTLAVSAFIAHTAIHRVLDRGQALAQEGSFASERALLFLTLGWALTMMLIAIAELVRRRRAPGHPAAMVEKPRA